MKKVLSILLAMVLVLTVLCSFSFAAEAPEEESDDVMEVATYCPVCGDVATITTVTTDPVYETCPICKNETVLSYSTYQRVVCNSCGTFKYEEKTISIYLCGCK